MSRGHFQPQGLCDSINFLSGQLLQLKVRIYITSQKELWCTDRDRCSKSELQVVAVRCTHLSSTSECQLRARMARELNIGKSSDIFYKQQNKKISIGSLSCCCECTSTILNGCHLHLLPSSAYRIAVPPTAGADSFNTWPFLPVITCPVQARLLLSKETCILKWLL